MGSHFLLQEVFLTQGLNSGLPHCTQILYCLSHQESPFIYPMLDLKYVQPFFNVPPIKIRSLILLPLRVSWLRDSRLKKRIRQKWQNIIFKTTLPKALQLPRSLTWITQGNYHVLGKCKQLYKDVLCDWGFLSTASKEVQSPNNSHEWAILLPQTSFQKIPVPVRSWLQCSDTLSQNPANWLLNFWPTKLRQ